jgi:hypothetical protein
MGPSSVFRVPCRCGGIKPLKVHVNDIRPLNTFVFMDVTVCPCEGEGHRDCAVLMRARKLSEAESPVDLEEVDTMIEWVRAREVLLRESRQALEQRRIRDLLKEKMGEIQG